MDKTLEEQAFEIGYQEAEENGHLVTPARSEKMMDFISENSLGIGDSIPWLRAFNSGQAKWLEEDVRRRFNR